MVSNTFTPQTTRLDFAFSEQPLTLRVQREHDVLISYYTYADLLTLHLI